MIISYLQALLLGLVQGISELFPISSLGHSVLFAWILGWNNIVSDQSQAQSFFLAFLVVLHIGTALALLVFYWREWVRIVKGFFRSLKQREVRDSSERLAWLIVVATIPAGLVGFAFQKVFTTEFGKPLFAAIFLIINGLILFAGDRYIRLHHAHLPKHDYHLTTSADRTATHIGLWRSVLIGCAQILALIAGISRSGTTMVAGLYSGLSYEDAARFAFLLATPIIFAAGLLKVPSLFGPLAAGVHGQIIVGGIAAAIAAYFSVRFLDKYFQNKGFRPFAYYCVFIGLACIAVGLSGFRHF